jgi:type I restriction enzyme, S subunit
MADDRLERTTFAKLISDGALEIGDGYRAKNEELGGDGLMFLRAGHVTDTHIDFDGVDRFHVELEPRVRSKLAKPGDAVITTKGNSTGRTTFVSPSMPPFVYSPHLSYWRSLDRNRIEGGFLRYWCRSSEFAVQLAGMKASTDMAPYLSLVDQKRLQITLPPVNEQRAIVYILGTLDDKIELNRRMNETLEAMARAIFKSWFVDFDPVRAKAEGRAPGLPKHIADLFPDCFEDSELGEIPAGWKAWCVSRIGPVICGKTPSTTVAEYYGHDVPFITIPDMHDKIFITNTQRKLSRAGATSQQNKALPAGALCVSCIATPGLVVITSEESQTNQQINSVVPSAMRETYFWFWTFRDLGDEIKAGGSGGSVLNNLSTGRFAELRVLAPPAELRNLYHSCVAPLFDRILTNEQAATTLAAVRDALLPRLISGELRLEQKVVHDGSLEG